MECLPQKPPLLKMLLPPALVRNLYRTRLFGNFVFKPGYTGQFSKHIKEVRDCEAVINKRAFPPRFDNPDIPQGTQMERDKSL